MAATEKQWFVGEDGCISVGEPTRSVTYNSALNSIIVSTKEPSVKIYDVASGSILQKSNVSGTYKHPPFCIQSIYTHILVNLLWIYHKVYQFINKNEFILKLISL